MGKIKQKAGIRSSLLVTIDYTKHDPLHLYLASHYSTSPFDLILDTIGLQPLYDHSTSYLTRPTSGRQHTYLNIGMLYPPTTFFGFCRTALSLMRITLLSSFLGGGPGGYSLVRTGPSKTRIEKVRRLVEEGKLRVVVDSVWDMGDAMKAYERSMTKHAKGKIVVKIQEVGEGEEEEHCEEGSATGKEKNMSKSLMQENKARWSKRASPGVRFGLKDLVTETKK
ncbi:hypothetical protein ACJ72_05301 [Emergomyces africanus]|uniref:Uncharacterized protein n=1 Tax=Emergomyces africanus TaxID=1955775 RepID=A0A1B7NUC6_9EURO|nr:hypothetical protein ACJ72_05301 [Emergomyces africanus]